MSLFTPLNFGLLGLWLLCFSLLFSQNFLIFLEFKNVFMFIITLLNFQVFAFVFNKSIGVVHTLLLMYQGTNLIRTSSYTPKYEINREYL